MPYYRQVGEVPRKRHTQFRQPDGGLYAEELMGVEGFSSDSSLLYHRHLPTAIVDARGRRRRRPSRRAPNHPLQPRHFRTHKLDAAARRPGDRPAAPARPTTTSGCRTSSPTGRRRSTATPIGDECVYVQGGSAAVETVFGALDGRRRRLRRRPDVDDPPLGPDRDEPLRLLVIEASGHIGPPRRYLSRRASSSSTRPYCERDLRGPGEPLLVEGEDVEVRACGTGTRRDPLHLRAPPVRRRRLGRLPLPVRVHHPRLRADHRAAAPAAAGAPDVRGAGFVICSFVPRLFDYHPQAIPAPYNHANVDSDEVHVLRRRRLHVPQGLRASSWARSRCTRPASPTVRSRGRWRRRSAVEPPTSSPSWSTRSARSTSAAALACEDPGYAWTWAGRSVPDRAADGDGDGDGLDSTTG